MKNRMSALALLPALVLSAASASAQATKDGQEASWSELTIGERIEITFRSGGTIVGKLVAPDSKLKIVDYSKEASLTLDLSEEAGTDGTMTVTKKEIKSVRKLGVEKKPISDFIPPRKPKSVEDPKPEKPPAPAPAPEATPKPETDEERQARLKKEEEEKLKAEAIAFYAKFQPPYWGPERHAMNAQKKARGQAWSAAEGEFEKDYEKLWKKGQDASPKPEPKKD